MWRAQAACRSRAARQPARDRSQDAAQAAACRFRQSVAVGDRRPAGGEGLRDRARRCLGRRPRSAGRSAAPMRWGGAAIDPTDPVLPEGVEPLADHVTAPAELHRRLRQIGLVDRADAARFAAAAQARPAAGVARRRSVALGRFRGRRQCADRRRPPSRRAQPAGRDRAGAGFGARAMRKPSARSRRRPRPKRLPPTRPRPQRAIAGANCSVPPTSARERHASAERDLSHITNRRAALTEAQARLGTSSEEAMAAHGEAQRALVRVAAGRRTGSAG